MKSKSLDGEVNKFTMEEFLLIEECVPNRESLAAMEAGERGEVNRAASVEAMMAELNGDD